MNSHKDVEKLLCRKLKEKYSNVRFDVASSYHHRSNGRIGGWKGFIVEYDPVELSVHGVNTKDLREFIKKVYKDEGLKLIDSRLSFVVSFEKVKSRNTVQSDFNSRLLVESKKTLNDLQTLMNNGASNDVLLQRLIEFKKAKI